MKLKIRKSNVKTEFKQKCSLKSQVKLKCFKELNLKSRNVNKKLNGRQIKKSNLKTEFKSQISSQVTCFKELKFLILKLWLSGSASNINDLSFKSQ